ncbi:MAG: LCP family protein, partial [Pseudonocardia sp.]|nr:LCP family protein [Pseudonocardia sp.]
MAALVALALLVLLGAAWFYTQQLNGRLTRADVISGPGLSSDQNILVVGVDSRTDAQGDPLPQQVLDQLHAGGSDDGGDNTDTMIVVHIPAGGGEATGFSIPRDSYVAIPGYGTHKINSAYTYGHNAARDALRSRGVSGPALAVQSAAAGGRTAIATVEQLTGLTITHYAAINLAGFFGISQAVGGVPVCLVAPVDDSYSGAHFPAGPQTVQGAAALAFVRQRHGLPDGDLDRVRRQQEFIASMAHTVLSA